MIVRPVQNRTPEQTAFLEHLVQSDATVAKAFTLAQDFGRLLRQREGKLRLEQWKISVQESGIAELIAFFELVGRRCRGCGKWMQHDVE